MVVSTGEKKSYFKSNKIIKLSWIEDQQYQYFRECSNEEREHGVTSLSAHVISKEYPLKAEIQQCVLTILSWPWLAENASQSPFEMRQGKTKPVRMSWRDVYWEPHVVRNRVGREGDRERERARERERWRDRRNCSFSTGLCPWDTHHAAPPTVGDSDRILSVQHSPSVWLMSLILPINGESPVDYHQIAVCNC